MTLSEVFYEAACVMSSGRVHNTVAAIRSVSSGYAVNDFMDLCDDVNFYFEVEEVASELGWKPKDFRAFVLLMASEAVKC